MVMNGFEIEKKCDADPEQAIEAACQRLMKMGYLIREREAGKVALKFQGSFFAPKIEEHSHHLRLAARKGSLHFEFSTGVVASYWTEADRKRVDEHIVAAVLDAIAEAQSARGAPAPLPPAPEGMARCRFCQKINRIDAPACVGCGAVVFC